VSFASITLYVASQRVFIVVSIYFVIDSVGKLLKHSRFLVRVCLFFLYECYIVSSSVIHNMLRNNFMEAPAM
jgi:hypothetical protein